VQKRFVVSSLSQQETLFVDPTFLQGKLSDDAELMTADSNPAGFAKAHHCWVVDQDQPHNRVASYVLRPSTNEDVMSAVKFATNNGLDLAVRSGGHGMTGKVLTHGGVLVDMRSMNQVTYNAETQQVTVGGGALVCEITDALRPVGRSPPTGLCHGVGAGIMHGGWGPHSRTHGLVIDNVISATMVTADGELRYVDATTETDLFWALRGNVSNFGVLTSVTYKTFDVTGGFSFIRQVFSLDNFRKAATYMNSQKGNRNFGGVLNIGEGNIIQTIWEWGGDISKHVTAQGIDGVEMVSGNDYFDHQQAWYEFTRTFPDMNFLETVSGGYNFVGNTGDDTFLEAFAEHCRHTSASMALWEMWGGAIKDVALDATPFSQRCDDNGWMVASLWNEASLTTTNASAIEDIGADLLKYPGSGSQPYINYVSGSETAMNNSYGCNTDRLKILKRKYDPENVFSHSYNVK